MIAGDYQNVGTQIAQAWYQRIYSFQLRYSLAKIAVSRVTAPFAFVLVPAPDSPVHAKDLYPAYYLRSHPYQIFSGESAV